MIYVCIHLEEIRNKKGNRIYVYWLCRLHSKHFDVTFVKEIHHKLSISASVAGNVHVICWLLYKYWSPNCIYVHVHTHTVKQLFNDIQFISPTRHFRDWTLYSRFQDVSEFSIDNNISLSLSLFLNLFFDLGLQYFDNHYFLIF